MTISSVSLVGSGNVATHIGRALQENGIFITGVYSQTLENANTLADELQTFATNSITHLPAADLCLIAVKDEVIASVSREISNAKIVAHTSGPQPISCLNNNLGEQAVFYPLQTFSKGIKLDWSDIPILVETHNEDVNQALFHLATKLSSRVENSNSNQRSEIHLAAVFVNNFVTHILESAELILEKHKLPIDLFHPLLEETIRKSMVIGPRAALTGPAKRKDHSVISAHLDKLKSIPEAHDLYKFISNRILERTAD